MINKTSLAASIAALLVLPLGGVTRTAVLADDAIETASPPVLTIHSTGGTITLTPAGDDRVRVTSLAAQAARVSRFDPSRMGEAHVMLPERFVRRRVAHGWRVYRLPARQFSIPMARFGREGVNVENPGGDMSIALPKRVGAVFINAEAGNVNVHKLRGPFVIWAPGGNVHLLDVAGRGLIRTTSGAVTLGGVGGDVHVQTADGAVTVYGSYAGAVDVQTDSGPILWRFARLGDGVYRFRSRQGSIRLDFRPEAAAQVDAQSETGGVLNLFGSGSGAGTAQVRIATAHALSLAVNGGGPEITATTTSGDITIEPVTP